MSEMRNEIKYIKEKLANIPTKAEMDLANRKIVEEVLEAVKKDYVSKDEFTPVKNIVWGVAGASGLAIVAAVMALIIK